MGVERDPVKAAVSHRELVGRGSRQSFEVSLGSYWRQGGCTHSKVRARDFVIPKVDQLVRKLQLFGVTTALEGKTEYAELKSSRKSHREWLCSTSSKRGQRT